MLKESSRQHAVLTGSRSWDYFYSSNEHSGQQLQAMDTAHGSHAAKEQKVTSQASDLVSQCTIDYTCHDNTLQQKSRSAIHNFWPTEINSHEIWSALFLSKSLGHNS